ncbi:MAG: trypsin-like peptidase domain-containing protein [Bacteroidales bacterium]|nr:trypsin-like peptidase domain-containing protein [Bacteroidales bacterium]
MKKTVLLTVLTLMACKAQTQELADLFEKNKHSVVTIYVNESLSTGTGDPRTFTSSMGLGSGVLVRDDIVLTAAHVVGNAEQIMVQFYDGESIEAKTTRISRIADVALITLSRPPAHAQVAVIGNSDEVRIGDEVFVVGAPLGLPYSLSRGVISGKHAEHNLSNDGKIMEFFQTDAAINTGNSGGPMFNYNGEVIGIVSSIMTRSGGFEGIGFAATSNVSRALLTERGSKFFGIEAMVLSYEMARILNVPQESGWLVQHVVKESPAGMMGIKGGFRIVTLEEEDILLGGDIILQVDDILITGEESVLIVWDYLNSVQSTITHQIRVLRAGEIIELRWVSSEFQPTRQ